MTGTPPERRLSKRTVEVLLATYDADPVGALVIALRRLGEHPTADFDQLIQLLADEGRITVDRQLALVRRDVAALDALASELNEARTLPTTDPAS
jgi:hypothetical protein